MAVIRTRRLAIGVIPAAGTVDNPPDIFGTPESKDTAGYVYTCPQGVQAVVRNVDLWPLTPNVPPDVLAEEFVAFVAWCVQPWQAPTVVICNIVTTTVRTVAQWQGTCVLHPGDQVYVTSSLDVQPLHYQISGAELVIP